MELWALSRVLFTVKKVLDRFLPALAWKRLGDYLHETQLLLSIQSTLYWDQNTRMPVEGASWRGEQLSLLAKKLHARQSSTQLESLLTDAKIECSQALGLAELGPFTVSDLSRNIELLKQDLERQKKIDPELVGRLAISKAEGYELWQKARAMSDFSMFAPALSNLISLRKEQARQLAEDRSCWETLAQPFEPDITLKRLKELFDPLRRRLPELLRQATELEPFQSSKWDLSEASQHELCEHLLDCWGRDGNSTALAKSPHPFSITLGPKDFRLTTRIVSGQPLSCFLATAHEWGHSLYEQGLSLNRVNWFGWPLGQPTSMALHESQSLFWENRVARSYEFSERFWPYFAKAGAPLNRGLELWRAMNPLTPGANRVEADELTYGLHILIRTDLEIALLEQGLPVEDLPYEWNRRYRELLGVTPKDDGEGCLQDVHWSEGQFGYFPSYLLGHLISAQLSNAMNKALKDIGLEGQDSIGECIRSGQEKILLSWLRKEVHPHGRKMNAEALVKQVSGSNLSSSPFLSYLENKIEMLTTFT